MDQPTTDPWITLFRDAISNDVARPLVVALATVDADGNPHVRNVVCRKFDDRDGSLWFTSDARSAKNAQLAAHPVASAACWQAESRQQFRFSGPVSVCNDPAERQHIWATLKPETRATFAWPAPGTPVVPASTFASTSDDATPPPNFSVLVLRPAEVEHLDVTKHPHRRRRWRAANAWRREELNP